MTLPSGWENFISVKGPMRESGNESYVLQLLAGYENALGQYWGFSQTINVYEYDKEHDPVTIAKKYYRAFATSLKDYAATSTTTYDDVTVSIGETFAMGDPSHGLKIIPQVQTNMLNDEWTGSYLPDTVPYNDFINQ